MRELKTPIKRMRQLDLNDVQRVAEQKADFRSSYRTYYNGKAAFIKAAISMPELPEVELVTRFLSKLVSGRRIEKATLVRERLAPHSGPTDFAHALSGSVIESVRRRGKHILFDLDNDNTLLTHLRMSGRFMLLDEEIELPKFSHAIFELDGRARLVFQDQRHFGFMRIAKTSEINELPEIKKLAPEPFSDEFSPAYLYATLKQTSRPLKQLLLDQSCVCGLGNIYAAEALYLSGIHPSKRSHTVSRPRTELLHSNIRQILHEAINAGSTLNIDPADSDSAYYGGEYERYWRVYDRESEPCPNCGTLIRRLKQGGRSTFFCPKCQKR
jgi:formamidopyrimidine-DNA glycosylase